MEGFDKFLFKKPKGCLFITSKKDDSGSLESSLYQLSLALNL